MPDIFVSNSWQPITQKVFWLAATLACIALKADHYDAKIKILRAKLPRGTRAGLSKVSPKEFELPVHYISEPGRAIHAIGHELIHFAQFMRGDLNEDRSEDGETVSSLYWKGVQYRVSPDGFNINTDIAVKAYLALPWEKEAFDRHDQLFKTTANQIPPQYRIDVIREYQQEMLNGWIYRQ